MQRRLNRIAKVTLKPGEMPSPIPAVMVSCGTMEKSNIITIGWTGIINSKPPMTYISIRPERFSHDMIEKSGEFVINLVNEKLCFARDYFAPGFAAGVQTAEAIKVLLGRDDTLENKLYIADLKSDSFNVIEF